MLLCSKLINSSSSPEPTRSNFSLQMSGISSKPTYISKDNNFELYAFGTIDFINEIENYLQNKMNFLSDDFADAPFKSQGILIICDKKEKYRTIN